MKQELFEQLETLWNELVENHNQTTKAAAGRARKAASNLKKAIAAYNKASVAESKAK
jgi:hypothetical protein